MYFHINKYANSCGKFLYMNRNQTLACMKKKEFDRRPLEMFFGHKKCDKKELALSTISLQSY